MKSKLDKKTRCQIVQREFEEYINKLYHYDTEMKFKVNSQTISIAPSDDSDYYPAVYVMIGKWPFRQIALHIGTDLSGGYIKNPKLISFKEEYLPLLPAIISEADEIEMIAHHKRRSQEELMTTRKEAYTNHIRQIVKK